LTLIPRAFNRKKQKFAFIRFEILKYLKCKDEWGCCVMVRGMIPDQTTIKRSEMLAKEKTERYKHEAREVQDYSKLETVIALLLGIIAIGFVIFVLNHYL